MNRYRLMVTYFVVPLLFLLAISLLARSQREPTALLQEIEAHRQRIQDVLLEGVLITETKHRGVIKRVERPFVAAFKRPNRFRFEIKGEASVLMVSDGDWMWTFRGRSQTYTQRPAPTHLPAFDHWMGLPIPLQIRSVPVLIVPTADVIHSITLVGRESLHLRSGEDVLCSLHTAQMNQEMLSGYDRGRVKAWVGVRDFIPWKIESTFGPASSDQRESRVTLAITSVKVDEGLPDAMFAFAPSPEARLVR